jgi:hypothetical protein
MILFSPDLPVFAGMEVNMLKIDDGRKIIHPRVILVFLSAMLLFPIASLQVPPTACYCGLSMYFQLFCLYYSVESDRAPEHHQSISRFLYPVLGRLFRVSAEGCYPIALGFLSGIPMGAKATADLIARQKINRREGQFLLGMCNNASPMFILGYISVTQLKLPQIKYTLFAIIYVSSILSAVLYRVLTQRKSEQVQPEKSNHPPEELQPRFSFQLLMPPS